MRKYTASRVTREDSQVADVFLNGLNLPKSRSSKINQFKHYATDAPV